MSIRFDDALYLAQKRFRKLCRGSSKFGYGFEGIIPRYAPEVFREAAHVHAAPLQRYIEGRRRRQLPKLPFLFSSAYGPSSGFLQNVPYPLPERLTPVSVGLFQRIEDASLVFSAHLPDIGRVLHRPRWVSVVYVEHIFELVPFYEGDALGAPLYPPRKGLVP